MDNSSCWTEARREILAWLKRNAASLAELYEGAVLMLYDSALPGRTRFIGHAVREIRNRLPDAFSGGTRSQRLEYTKRLDSISKVWSAAGLRAPSIPEQVELRAPSLTEISREVIGIPAEVHQLVNELVTDHLRVPETRAGAANRFFEACAPENQDLRETMRPVILHWMAVTEWFMDRTHDSGNPDAAYDPEEFRRKFELFESVLGSLIGAFYASSDRLDEILADPDLSLVDSAVALIARAEHHRYFFDKLNDARWIEPLAAKGFFRAAPPLIPVPGGPYLKAPPWPESRFLARIAGSATAEQQAQIVDLALALCETKNVSVQQDLAEIALALPPQLAVRFVPKAKKWMENYTFLLVPLKLGELAIHLARARYHREAIDLTRRVLSPRHTPRRPDAEQQSEKSSVADEPLPRFEPLFYGEILKKIIPELVRAAGSAVLEMLGDMLVSAIHCRRADEQDRREDYSTGWRPAIEDHDENLPARDLRAMLAVAVRDAADQLAETAAASIPSIVEQLEGRQYPIFSRIALHLLRVRADSPPGLVRDRLISRDLFDSSAQRHEYTLLLQHRFGALDPADRDRILGWIEAGPDTERFAASHESWFGRPPSQDETQAFADHYRLERLWPIRSDLPEAWRQGLASLVARYGEPEQSGFLHVVRIDGVTLEDRSPKTVDEFRQMGVEAIVEYVRLWQPPGGFRGPTREGLTFVLMKLVAEEPQRFASAPQILQVMPPALLMTIVEGFREAVIAGRFFAWPGVLGTCIRILSGGTDTANSVEHPDWANEHQARLIDAITSLLESALEHHSVPIPYDQSPTVEEVLQRLADVSDPPPSSVVYSSDFNPLKSAPFDRPPRVKILNSVVFYAIWVARQVSAGQQEVTLPGGLDAVPPVRDILTTHLDRERHPSLGVRAFFGRNLPRLAALDAPWTEGILPQIFPADGATTDAYQAAWRGYLHAWKYPRPQIFRLLGAAYESAVDRLQPTAPDERDVHDPEPSLARHVMTMYWLGEIQWGSDDSLLNRFFARADDGLRAQAVQYLGMSLAHEPSLPAHTVDRLRRLWEIRREATIDPAGHTQELAAFGWWPVSRKFDEAWAIAQLTEILSRAGKVAPEAQMLQWLADVAARLPREAIRCLELFAEGCDWDFHLFVWNTQIASILGAGLRAQQSDAREAARALVNRLGTRGHREFRSLLQNSGGSEQ